MLRQDFIDTFQTFYKGNIDLTWFNRAYLALMPKVAGARRVGVI